MLHRPEPTVLRHTPIAGLTVSTVRVHTDFVGGGYHETMLFLNGKTVEGLTDFECFEKFKTWEENHEALCFKARSVLAFGPVLPH